MQNELLITVHVTLPVLWNVSGFIKQYAFTLNGFEAQHSARHSTAATGTNHTRHRVSCAHHRYERVQRVLWGRGVGGGWASRANAVVTPRMS